MTELERRDPCDDALALLAAGVPLTLLLDLALPVRSQELLREEPADLRWLSRTA